MMVFMGRPLRLDYPGAWHHVMNRASGRRIVFRDDAERELFIERLGELEERFDVEVHAYCLMGTHFHLLLRSRDGNLSAAMQWLSSGFTREVNSIRAVDGPIFRGRFRSVLVVHNAHLIWLFRYIHANPIDLGWTLPFCDYEWSSLGPAVGVRPEPSWLHTDFALGLFGDDVDRYLRFVENAREPLELTIGRGRRVPCTPGVDSRSWASTLEAVENAIELASGFRVPSHPAGDQRYALALIVTEPPFVVPADVIIDHLGIEERSLPAFVSRARRRHDDDPAFRTLVGRSLELISATSLRVGV